MANAFLQCHKASEIGKGRIHLFVLQVTHTQKKSENASAVLMHKQ
jgi:hypothetical protein